MANQVGQTCKFYRNTGTFASPTWVEINNVQNLKIGSSRTKAAAPTRASIYNKSLVGQLDLVISFQMPRDVSDTDFTTLRTAFLAGTTVGFAYAAGAIATPTTRYVKLECKIVKMDEDEPLDAACMVDVELVVAADSTNDPTEATTP